MDKVDDYNLPFRAAAMISHLQVPKQSSIHSKGMVNRIWVGCIKEEHAREHAQWACARMMRAQLSLMNSTVYELNC